VLYPTDNAQQAFSSDNGPTLHLTLPALEALHHAWSSRSKRSKYAHLEAALDAGVAKIVEYYDKMADSDVFIFAMCMFHLSLLEATRIDHLCIVLHPEEKMTHLQKYWSKDLQNAAQEEAEKIVR
jgi:hypothetical protein